MKVETSFIEIASRKLESMQKEFIAISWYHNDVTALWYRVDAMVEILTDVSELFFSNEYLMLRKRATNLKNEVNTYYRKERNGKI